MRKGVLCLLYRPGGIYERFLEMPKSMPIQVNTSTENGDETRSGPPFVLCFFHGRVVFSFFGWRDDDSSPVNRTLQTQANYAPFHRIGNRAYIFFKNCARGDVFCPKVR